MSDLPIIQKAHDLIKWYVPILNRLPRQHRFALGERMISILYQMLEDLITARYAKEKLTLLEPINAKLHILRHQTRILFEFDEMSIHRYKYAGELIDGIGSELGGWIKHQRKRTTNEWR